VCVCVSDLVPRPSFVSAVDAVEARIQRSVRTAGVELINTGTQTGSQALCEGHGEKHWALIVKGSQMMN